MAHGARMKAKASTGRTLVWMLHSLDRVAGRQQRTENVLAWTIQSAFLSFCTVDALKNSTDMPKRVWLSG